MTMNLRDYAIVIGIQRYPMFGSPYPGEPNDLAGPNLDAQMVYDWLADENGGGIPVDNRLLVTSADFPDPFEIETLGPIRQIKARPTADELKGCFGWLIRLFEASNSKFLGRRLYVYFSGHGFGVDDCDGGVFAANADVKFLQHFYVRRWFDWLYKNAYFEELILWTDACSDPVPIGGQADRGLPSDTSAPHYPGVNRSVVFAAKHPLKSVERRMPDGNIRGVFTYALLEGLKGAAVDAETGWVTSRSLQRYLEGGMETFMEEEDIEDPDVSNKPSFGVSDEIRFVEVGVQSFTLKVRFAARHAGADAFILDGRFDRVGETNANAETWTVTLAPGDYFLQVGADGGQPLTVAGDSQDVLFIA